MLQWLCFEQYSHEPNIATRRFMLKHPGSYATPAEVLAQKLTGGYRALDIMEHHLAKAPFFVADAYTIADIALFAYTHVAEEGGFDLKAYPAIRAWCERVRSQPGFRALYSDWPADH